MKMKTASILIIMVVAFLIPINISIEKDNHDLSIVDSFYSNETNTMLPKDTPPASSINAVQSIPGIGSHKVIFDYYQAYVSDDHDAGIAGAGEWHFHVSKPSGDYIPNAPYDDSITFKVDGSGTVSLDNRWSGSKWVGGDTYGTYLIRTCAWEEDVWPLPKVDSDSVSLGYFDVEIQGNYYNGYFNEIPGNV